MSNKLRNIFVQQTGFTLVEAVVTIGIFAVGMIIAAQVVLTARRLSDESRDAVQAANYLEQGLEAVRSSRDSSWTTVATDGAYHLEPAPGDTSPWNIVAGGSETIGKFSRTVNISTGRRIDSDSSGTVTAGDQLVASGGTLDDPDTKKITTTVTWQQGSRTVSRSLYTYLTNWQN